MFAEVLLPLPIKGTFTYRIPGQMEKSIESGVRVFVPFGRKKFYTGIVVSTHDNPPEGYEVKNIALVLDTSSIVRYPQLKFWNWIADYYLCTPGEVFRAAVPTGLKIESETVVSLNPDYEPEPDAHLTEHQAKVVALLDAEERLAVSRIAERTGISNASPVVAKLLDMGVVQVDERIVEKYRPERKTLVRLTIERSDNDALHAIFDTLKRARAQERLLVAYLEKSGWLQQHTPLKDVERKELISVTGCSPGALKLLVDKGFMEVYKKSINRFNHDVPKEHQAKDAELSDAQKEAYSLLKKELLAKHIALLHGVTGSGKTEIYINLINEALRARQQVLYLVPEISLTTQLTDRLRKVFGNSLLVYHSKFSDNERVDIYRKVLETNDPLVVLGARSSVFLPFARIGLVIVDEEHESSYKQYDPAPRYNARDAALVLASFHGAFAVLGSATPSVETYYKAKTGKYGLAELSQRYGDVSLPNVSIVDMRKQRRQRTSRGSLSLPLIQTVSETLANRRQVIMFQNRRGFAPMVVCKECGWTPKCTNCDVSMVYHKNLNQLRCHYCGHYIQLPKVCPACGLNGIETYGYGTERITEDVADCFPDAKVSRMDLDTTRNKNAYQEIIEEFADHKTDILVGTQMVSKGLDFEKVDVVGVINADTLLNFPDFRSDERAFNMLEQVAGRAGRRTDTGEVIIQTTDPGNDVLAFVTSHDYKAFYEYAVKDRERYSYPPFTKVINIYLKHADRETVDSLAVEYVIRLRRMFGSRVLGPERPPVGRVANRYIQSVMLKVEAGASMPKVKALLRNVYEQLAPDARMKQATIVYDVDPV